MSAIKEKKEEKPSKTPLKPGFQLPADAALPTGQFKICVSISVAQARKIQVVAECTTATTSQALGTTETLDLAANAQTRFTKAFSVPYWFEVRQYLSLSVQQVDANAAATPIASIKVALGSIVTTKGEFKLALPESSIDLFLTAQPENPQEQDMLFHFKGEKLDNKDLIGKSDPLFVVSRVGEDGKTLQPLFRSKYLDGTLNPEWDPVYIRTFDLGGTHVGNPDTVVEIGVWDWDSKTKQDFIGSVRVKLGDFVTGVASKRAYALINPKKKEKKKNYEDSGKLIATAAQFVPRLSLTHFMGSSSRVRIHLAVGVCFSLASGFEQASLPLHERKSGNNVYQQLMKSFANVVLPHTDGTIEAWGYGGQQPTTFPLMKDQRMVNGLQGLMQGYDDVHTRKVVFWAGNTPGGVIGAVAEGTRKRLAEAKEKGDETIPYTVLVLLTHGTFDNYTFVQQATIPASSLPMSILIVGIGRAQYKAMDWVVQDETPVITRVNSLTTEMMTAVRQRARFYKLRRFNDNTDAIAAAALRSVPDDIVDYMRMEQVPPVHH